MTFHRVILLFLRAVIATLLLITAAACTAAPDFTGEPAPETAGEAPDGEGSQQVEPTTGVNPEEPGTPGPSQPAVPETRRLTLEWPPTIRVGDSDVVQLTLEVDDLGNITPTAVFEGHELHGENVQIPNVYETHNVVAQARLDMAGVEVEPGEEISVPLRPGTSASFIWSVRPVDVGRYRGTVWLHLNFVPLEPGGQESRIPVTAQLIDIQAINFLGLGGTPARVLGGIGALAGSMISLDSLLPWVLGRIRRRRKPSTK